MADPAQTVEASEEEEPEPYPSPSPTPSVQASNLPPPATLNDAPPEVASQQPQNPKVVTQQQKDLESTTLTPTQAPSDNSEAPPEAKDQEPTGKPPQEAINDIASKNDRDGIFNLINTGQIDKNTGREALKARLELNKDPVQSASDSLVNGITSAGKASGGFFDTLGKSLVPDANNPLYQFGSHIGNALNEVRILGGPDMQNQPVASDLRDRMNAAKTAEIAALPPEVAQDPDAINSIQQKYQTQSNLIDTVQHLERTNGYGEGAPDKAQELARVTAINALDPNYLANRKQQAVSNIVSGTESMGGDLVQGAQNITKYIAPRPILDAAQNYVDSKKSDSDWNSEIDFRKNVSDALNGIKSGQGSPAEESIGDPLRRALSFAAGVPYQSPEQLTAKGEAPSPEKIQDISQTGQLAALSALPEMGLGDAIEGATTGLMKAGQGTAKGVSAAIGVGTKAAGNVAKRFAGLEAFEQVPEIVKAASQGGIAAAVHHVVGAVVPPIVTYGAAKAVKGIMDLTGNAFGKAAADSYSGSGILSNLGGWALRKGTEGALGIAPFAATNAQTPEEFGSNLALGSLMHVGARAPGDIWSSTAGPYFDGLFRSKPTQGQGLTQAPVSYGTLPAADALTEKLADQLPSDQRDRFTAVQNLMGRDNEVHLVPPQLYGDYFKLFNPTGELPNSNGFWISPEANAQFPGKGMSFIRSDRVPEALIHEGMGHPIYHSLPDDLKTVINRSSLDPFNGDLNQWTSDYFDKFGDPKLKGITYDSLPSAEEVNSGDPIAQAKATAALGYTKDDIMAERGAELLGKVIDGVPIDQLTSDPSNSRNLKYSLGKMFEFWGIPTVTPKSQSILGVNPSLSGALALEDYMRNYAKRPQQAPSAGTPGTEPNITAAPTVPKPTAPATNADTLNRQFDAISSGVAGSGRGPQTPIANLGTPNIPAQEPKPEQPTVETPQVEPPAAETVPSPTEIPTGEIPENRKAGPLSTDERGVVYNRILRREGASDEQGGQQEMYGFRSGDDPEAYQAIAAARAKYGQGSPQELAVVHQHLEAEAGAAGINNFNDPGLQSVVASMAHMRGAGGAQAILNAAVDGKVEQTGTLKPETIQALNNMTPEEAQARIRQAREEYDRRVYGHTNTTRSGKTSNWWDTYGNGLLSRYNEEASEGLAMSKGDPNAYRDELDAHRTFTGPTASSGEPETSKVPGSLVGQPITAPEDIVNAKRAIQAQTPTDDELARLAASGNKSAEEILRDNYGANWLSKVGQDARNEYGNAYPEESIRQNVGIIGQRDTGNRVLGEQAKVLQAVQEQGGLPSANALSRTGTYLEPNAEDLRDLHQEFNQLTPQEKQYLKNNLGVTPQKLFKSGAPNSEAVNANLTRQGVSNFGTPNDLFNHIYDTLTNMRQVMAGRPVLPQEGRPQHGTPNVVEPETAGRGLPTQEDLINAGNQAKSNVSTENAKGKDRTQTQAYQNEVNAAAMEAMLEHHAAALGPNDTQLRLFRDPDDPKKIAATGTHIDMEDPMNQILTSGQPQRNIDIANQFGNAINSRTPLDITHFSAERSLLPEDSRRASIRRREQEASPAGERAQGQAPGEALTKTIIPTRIEVGGLKTADRSILLRGISPDKLADNFRKIQERLPAEHPAKDIKPDEMAMLLRQYIDNHRAGYKGDGSAPLKGENVDPTYQPKELPKQVSDVINMAFGDTGAKANTPKGSRARESAQENEGFFNPTTGEVNPLRETLDAKARELKQSIPSEDLESPYETIRADNVQAIHGGPDEAPPERLREPGGPIQQTLHEAGFPNPRAVKAGFMPEISRENFMERARLQDARKRGIIASTLAEKRGESPANPANRSSALERYSNAIRESAPSQSFDSGPDATSRVLDEISFQEKQLLRHANKEGTLLRPNPKEADASGGEHLVWDNKNGTVTKETHGYKYGYTPFESGNPDAPVQMRYATPREYLDRIAAARDKFEDQTEVNGLVQLPSGELRIRTTQPMVGEGKAPSDEQVHDYMDEHGFVPDPATPGAWRHPDGTVTLDAENRNFALDDQGNVHPIDLMLRKGTPKFMPETKDYENFDEENPKTWKPFSDNPEHLAALQADHKIVENFDDGDARTWKGLVSPEEYKEAQSIDGRAADYTPLHTEKEPYTSHYTYTNSEGKDVTVTYDWRNHLSDFSPWYPEGKQDMRQVENLEEGFDSFDPQSYPQDIHGLRDEYNRLEKENERNRDKDEIDETRSKEIEDRQDDIRREAEKTVNGRVLALQNKIFEQGSEGFKKAAARRQEIMDKASTAKDAAYGRMQNFFEKVYKDPEF